MAKKISDAMHVILHRIERARKDGSTPSLAGYRSTTNALLLRGLVYLNGCRGHDLTDAGRLALHGAPVSYAIEVIADDSGVWCGNALRFATREEAENEATSLWRRWVLVRERRVVTSQDPVNYRWDEESGRAVSIEKEGK